MKIKWKLLLGWTAAIMLLLVIALGGWLIHLDHLIQKRFSEKNFLPPIQYYSGETRLFSGMILPQQTLEKSFQRLKYQKIKDNQIRYIKEGEYQVIQEINPEELEKHFGEFDWFKVTSVYRWHRHNRPSIETVFYTENNTLFMTFADSLSTDVYLEPELIAQLLGEEPILQNFSALGEFPLSCLQATLAIEDSRFLDHMGIKPSSILRAFLKNMIRGRVAEGGSTITQQMVKNFFLTSERTIRRKVLEMVMSILIELRLPKDQILETYLNIIYLGQSGPYQVRGFSSASEHYFLKPLQELNLAECALLAGIISSPGLYNPFQHPEKARKRRGMVLERMEHLGLIDQTQFKEAQQLSLPEKSQKPLSEPAPYFLQAAQRQLSQLKINLEQGAKVYTTLNFQAQEAAQKSVSQIVDELEIKINQKIKTPSKEPLEGLLVGVETSTGYVQSLVGGRKYIRSQFNRVLDSERQIGSLMKPLVVLTALESTSEDENPYTPLTLIKDEPFTHTYARQKWSPQNYDKKFHGPVPLYYALKNSLNVPIARLGIDIGLEKIISLSRQLSIESPMDPLPSLTLGSFAIRPWEVVQTYNTLARMGSFVPLTYIQSITTPEGQKLWQHSFNPDQVVDANATGILVGMLKHAFISGTARSAKALGFSQIAAGKTGTTSDYKDSWFCGFTPHHTALAWIGYDDNSPHDLTGASGALPLWVNYMNKYASQFPNEDFHWPENLEKKTINPFLLDLNGVHDDILTEMVDVELIMK